MTDPIVLIIAFDRFQLLDVAGPVEVFANAARYRVQIAAAKGGEVVSSSGVKLVADRGFGPLREPVDTLLVVGGRGVVSAMVDPELQSMVRRAAAGARRVAAVCSGAFVLAEAGLLDGRRATTHWIACDALAKRYPKVKVEGDPIFVRDGDVWTSAGVTAGMDLALALVADDYGPELALDIARQLVIFVQRPGGQSQWSAQLAAQAATREPLRELQGWIADHLTGDLTVPALAERAGMSTRHFARAFRAEFGVTPAAYVERVRIEAARRELHGSGEPVEEVARRCGFRNAETLHRAFRRRMGTTPIQYRRHFRRPEGAA